MIKIVYAINLVFVLITCLQKDYTDTIKLLQNSMKLPEFKHKSYDRIAYLTDTYGPRVWGSPVLQMAIQQVKNMAIKQGFENIRLEPVVNFTRWIRGKQTLTLLSPRPIEATLDIIGVGGSVPGNITGEVIVVNSWEDLQEKKDQVNGKIVCYNYKWINYSSVIDYRYSGASVAARNGAIAALVKSVTPDSIYSVHTGNMHYDDGIPQIPIAAITLEDSQMLQRMQNRNQKIIVRLDMQSEKRNNCCNSSNLVFEIVGYEKPDQILLMGGHIDTWDTGSQTGANDDGGGFFTVFEALRLLKKNNLRPRRTLRFIAWSGQEWGGYYNNGAIQYYNNHINQIEKHVVAFESDVGTTQLEGFGFSGSQQSLNLIYNISKTYMSLINATKVNDDGTAPDTNILYRAGVPVMDVSVKDTPDRKYYFTYHHSRGDTMNILNPDEMDSNVLGVAAMFYILADLENTITR